MLEGTNPFIDGEDRLGGFQAKMKDFIHTSTGQVRFSPGPPFAVNLSLEVTFWTLSDTGEFTGME